MEDDLPIIVIGGGIIGLSIAYELVNRDLSCIVVEARESFGEGASSRNSEVIHGGFLSAPDSKRQQLCIEGGKIIKNRISLWEIEKRICGKLVVAVEDEELPRLEEIFLEADRIGVEAIMLGEKQVRELEPALLGSFSESVWFPGSGVFDTHSYMQMLKSKSEEGGTSVLFAQKVGKIFHDGSTPSIEIEGEIVQASIVINSAGLDADRILSDSGVETEKLSLKQEAWPGRWYRVHPSQTLGMKRLVYRTSTPGQPGLGVHTTPDWAGDGVRLGPDSYFVDKISEEFESRHKFIDSLEIRQQFLARLGHLYPHLRPDHLIPDQVGIRSRSINRRGDADFSFLDGAAFGLPRTLHLLGMESPGITASPAIAETTADWVMENC